MGRCNRFSSKSLFEKQWTSSTSYHLKFESTRAGVEGTTQFHPVFAVFLGNVLWTTGYCALSDINGTQTGATVCMFAEGAYFVHWGPANRNAVAPHGRVHLEVVGSNVTSVVGHATIYIDQEVSRANYKWDMGLLLEMNA